MYRNHPAGLYKYGSHRLLFLNEELLIESCKDLFAGLFFHYPEQVLISIGKTA
jgi:hypothetical protein